MRWVSCRYISHPLDATPLHLHGTAMLPPAASFLSPIVARLAPRSPRCKIRLVTFRAHDLLAASRKVLNAQLWAMALDLPARARVTQPLIREHARPAQWKQPSVNMFNNWLNAAMLRSLSPAMMCWLSAAMQINTNVIYCSLPSSTHGISSTLGATDALGAPGSA